MMLPPAQSALIHTVNPGPVPRSILISNHFDIYLKWTKFSFDILVSVSCCNMSVRHCFIEYICTSFEIKLTALLEWKKLIFLTCFGQLAFCILLNTFEQTACIMYTVSRLLFKVKKRFCWSDEIDKSFAHFPNWHQLMRLHVLCVKR